MTEIIFGLSLFLNGVGFGVLGVIWLDQKAEDRF